MGGTSGCHSLIPSSPADDVDERQQPTIDDFPFRHEGKNAKERHVCKEREEDARTLLPSILVVVLLSICFATELQATAALASSRA